VSEDVQTLFDDFAARHARGAHPDVRAYLERAGDQRDELASLVDAFLAGAPAQPPSAETTALFASLIPEQAPLLAERVRQGWRRADVVEWIRERFGIPEEKREKVARNWHELETGLRPVSGVSVALREALAERFGEAAGAAAAWRAPGLQTRLSYLREQDQPELAAAGMPAAPPARAAEPDEVDRLFGTSPVG
jgi:hypothetical protein